MRGCSVQHNSTGASLRGSSLGRSAGTDVLNLKLAVFSSPNSWMHSILQAWKKSGVLGDSCLLQGKGWCSSCLTPLIKPTVWELTTHDCGSRWANQPGCVYGLGLHVPYPKETSGTNLLLYSVLIMKRLFCLTNTFFQALGSCTITRRLPASSSNQGTHWIFLLS